MQRIHLVVWLLGLLMGAGRSTAYQSSTNVVNLTLPDSSIYTGGMKDGLLHGKGMRLYHFGEKYEGEYWKGQQSGMGILVSHRGSKYIGYFSNDVYEGRGVLINYTGTRYAGDFKDGVFEGNGEIIYRNGNKAKGQFKQELLNGTGVYVYASGTTESGEFKNGYLNGQGTIQYTNGTVSVGTFKNSVLEGYGRVINSDGEIFEGLFKNGKLVQEKEKAGSSLPYQSERYPGDKPMYNIHGIGQPSFWLPFLLVVSVFFNVIMLLKLRPLKNWNQPQLPEKPPPDYSAALHNTEPFEKIAELETEVQAEALDALLAERGIPHLIRNYNVTALNGMLLSPGWGHVAAPKAHAAAVLQALKDLASPPAEPPA